MKPERGCRLPQRWPQAAAASGSRPGGPAIRVRRCAAPPWGGGLRAARSFAAAVQLRGCGGDQWRAGRGLTRPETCRGGGGGPRRGAGPAATQTPAPGPAGRPCLLLVARPAESAGRPAESASLRERRFEGVRVCERGNRSEGKAGGGGREAGT